MSDNPPELSRIYRDAAQETPPPALDAAILAAARARVAKPKPRRRGWWSRLMVPASLVATLVLGVSVSLRMVHERPETVTGSPAVSETATAGTSTPPPPEAKPQRGSVDHLAGEREARAPSAPAAEPKVAPPMGMAPSAAATAPRPAIARPPAPAIKQEEAAMPSAEANRAAPAAAVPAERRAAAVEAKRNQADMADAASESSAAVPSSSVAGAAPAAKAARSPAHAPSPADWIERIRRLKREGQEEEAARQLAEFRRAYPEFSVPDDLRNR